MTSDCDDASRQGEIEWLDDEAIGRTLTDLARSPESWDPGRNAGRWSLAGAQSKIALFRSPDGRWGVPCDSTPTTHILKSSMPNYEGHHLNEHLCLRAAQLCGLPAAATEVLTTDRYEVLVSRRYDRIQDQDGRWRRLHQEDLCQALSAAPGMKYQTDGGPWAAAGARLGMTRDRAIGRVQHLRARIPAAFFTAANESGVPESLRDRARWIAELIDAQVAGRRDGWGRLDVRPWKPST
ncbi:HipA domain-containing protein [Kribbella rubisoli]|uniref:HipA domain-containing protein n=1 Tax=Kribbella rubisoli TaxID=3075929 RepID=UPI0024115775|nr:HipA domain-containing protein [Kribbella rubisoli]